MKDIRQTLRDIEQMKMLLVSRARGRDFDDGTYYNLRETLLLIPEVDEQFPDFVHACRNMNEFWSYIKPKYQTYREREDHITLAFAPLLGYLEALATSPLHGTLTDALTEVNSHHVNEACRKALSRVHDNPDGAVTSSRSLLETVCKHILDEQKVEYEEKADLPDLYKMIAKHLKLAPDQHSQSELRQMLQGCTTVVYGVGSFRNRVGDAHGKGAKSGTVERRHAMLAVSIACAVSSFLIETWENEEAS